MTKAIAVLVLLAACEGGSGGEPDARHEGFCPDSCPENFRCGSTKRCERFRPLYAITIDEASLPATKLDGTPWDDEPLADAAPDPLVSVISSIGSLLGSTMTALNTTEARWTEPTLSLITIEKSMKVRLEAYDADMVGGLNQPELVLGCDVTVSLEPALPFECSADGGRVHGTVRRVE